jgi:CRP/FNR family transcriptional regulator, cyclic AMP receptor protein
MLDFFRKVPLFSKLNDSQLQLVASIGQRKTYKAGTILFHEKEPGSVFYIVYTGSVKIYTTSQAGEEKIFTIFKSSESFGELSLFDGKPRSTSAAVLEDTVLITITAPEFLELCRNNFEITHCIMQELCQRLRDTNQHVHDLTFLDARTRVIKAFILLANKNGIRDGHLIRIRMTLNYDELAQVASVQKSLLMQVTRDLQDKSILMFHPNEFVLDISKLR